MKDGFIAIEAHNDLIIQVEVINGPRIVLLTDNMHPMSKEMMT